MWPHFCTRSSDFGLSIALRSCPNIGDAPNA